MDRVRYIKKDWHSRMELWVISTLARLERGPSATTVISPGNSFAFALRNSGAPCSIAFFFGGGGLVFPSPSWPWTKSATCSFSLPCFERHRCELLLCQRRTTRIIYHLSTRCSPISDRGEMRVATRLWSSIILHNKTEVQVLKIKESETESPFPLFT